MSNFVILNGKNIKPNMLKDVLRLDKMVYEEKYWTNLEYMTKWFLKNPNIMTLLYDKEDLVGYFCYLPVVDESYLEIKKGEVFQDLTIPIDNVRKYEAGKNYNMYIFSIVLNPKYHGTDAVKYLLKGFYDNTRTLEEKGIEFNKVLADVVSNKGDKLATSLGFHKIYDTAYNSIMYENNYDNMIKNYKKIYSIAIG